MKRINKIKNYYGENMKNSNEDHAILGWESREAQYQRFSVMLDNVDLAGKKLIDVGCGLGNLLEYFMEKNIKVDYTGIDVLPEMIELAANKNLPGKFMTVDLFKENPFEKNEFNVLYCSGIFNLNLGNNRDFLQKALNVFLDITSDCICFNLLHEKSDDKEDTYYYFSPEEALEILEKAANGRELEAVVHENYLSNDFTVICRKV